MKSISVDTNHVKWVGFEEDGLWSFNDTVWSLHIPPGYTVSQFSSVAVDKDQSLWISARQHLSVNNSLFHVTSGQWLKLTPLNSGLPDSAVRSVSIDHEGRKWFSLDNWIVSYDNETWTMFLISDSSVKSYTNHFAFDSAGLPWITTNQRPLAWIQHFNGVKWESYEIPFQVGYARGIAIDALGNKWIGSDSGVIVFNENGITSDVDTKNNEFPKTIELKQNYPNPFNPQTTIEVSIPSGQYITLSIFNILGEEVTRLQEGYLNVGEHSFQWNGNLFSSGIYFYSLMGKNFYVTRKMLLIQ